MNPAEWLSRIAKRLPEAPALLVGDTCVATYQEFSRRAAAVAGALQHRGVQKGDRVALFSSNRTEYLEALYGIWWLGAAAVPINAKLHAKEVAWMIGNSMSSLIFCDDRTARQLAGELEEGFPVVSLQGEDFDSMREGASAHDPVALNTDELAWLFYTSGTTGRPKGVMMTCGNIQSMMLTYFSDVDQV